MADYNLYDVFDRISQELIDDRDLSGAFIYMIDLVNANALPFLAAGFNVEGFKGFELTTAESQKRELIKKAISIKRHLGTPYAIKQALSVIGFDKVVIDEKVQTGSSFYYNGDHTYDGSIMYGGTNWTLFDVIITVSDPSVITDEQVILIRQLINYYKRAISTLSALIFKEADLHYYDGTYTHDGTITYS